MKKIAVWMLAACAGAGFGWMTSHAEEAGRWLTLENTLGVGYDDNVGYNETNKVDRLRITDRVGLTADRALENGFIGLRYQLSYTQYDSGDSGDGNSQLTDETFWSHQADFDLNKTFSPKLKMGIRETFLYTERPEIENPDGTIRQQDSTYYYNTINLNASSMLTARWGVDADGRWQIMRYSENEDLGQREDYDQYSAGLNAFTQLGQGGRVGLSGRYNTISYLDAENAANETVTYENANQQSDIIPDRGYDLYSIGLMLSDIINPSLIATLNAGWQVQEYAAANIDSNSSPYADATLTYLPNPGTRITASGSYSLYQSGLLTYSGQTRTAGSLSVAQDFTRRLTGTVIGSYIMSEYDGDSSVNLITNEPVTDSKETAFSVSTILAYQIGQRNWVQVSYSWNDFNSDLPSRNDYQRNTFDVSWRIRL